MARAESGAIEFRLLGPIEVARNGDTLSLGGPRQRALLGLLLLEPGRPVSVDRLVDELWHGQPPAGAATTLRAYVSRLRTVLGEDAVITSAGSGYALDVVPDRIDASRFERLTKEGHEALARGAVRRASERLRAALDLWRGRPFAGIADEGALRLEAQRLEERRLFALEERIEADLALGRHDELVDEIETLVAEHLYRERLWRQLMLALYRCGRQADALDAYRRARMLLYEELGLEPGEELRALEQAILRHEVPPARPPEERHNVPAPLTSFVGREAELSDVERLLAETRLLTLTGVGGAGKTRLALEAAARAIDDAPDGVFFVDFSALTEPTLVDAQVAAALDVRSQSDAPLGEQLAARLREADLLLVLDNCEHLRDACAELAQHLLADCRRVRILATSRELLGVPGETDYAVPPLAVPPPDADADELRRSEAVRLFLARARTARPRLADDTSALSSAGRICRDLDGLPLAIELAAARANALSLDEIADRVADRFRFLVSWRRLATARHRTLREAIDWSHDLLAEDERVLLARLSVFAGGFTLAAAASVCLDGDDAAAVDLVARLVEASLVVAEERDGRMRYRILETVRQYAAERLGERGETDVARRRHADYFTAFAEEASPLQEADLDAFVEHHARDQDNLRAALAWARDADEPETLLRLANAMWRFWWVRGDFREGRAWLDAALAARAAYDTAARAEALEGAAGLAWADGDLIRAREFAETAQPLFRSAGDRRGEHACLTVLGLVALARDEFDAAEELFEDAATLAHDLGDGVHLAVGMHNLGSVAFARADFERAAERYETARTLYREQSDAYGVALSDLYLGLVAIERAQVEAAAAHVGRAFPVFREMGFLQYATQCVEATAVVLHACGRIDDATRLLGAGDALRDRIGNPPGGVPPHRREHVLLAARTALGEPAFDAAWAEGRTLTQDQAFDHAERALAD